MVTVPPSGPPSPAPQISGNSAQAQNNALSGDFDTFLKMLTIQMQNQDPFNPIKSEEFAVQLATFSGVEQQIKTNKLLETLAGGFSGNSLVQLAGWVGMEARAQMPARFAGSPVTIFPAPHQDADQAVLVVRDVTGAEVSRSAIGLSGAAVEWAGVSESGQPFPPGIYSFSVESYKEGKSLGTKHAEIFATIREVRLEDDKAVLVMDSGEKVTAEDITALRTPG